MGQFKKKPSYVHKTFINHKLVNKVDKLSM